MEALNALGMHPKQSEPADQREEDEKPEEPGARVTGLACSGSRVHVLSWRWHIWMGAGNASGIGLGDEAVGWNECCREPQVASHSRFRVP